MPDRFIQNYDHLATSDQRKVALELIEAAYDAIQPYNVIDRKVRLDGEMLHIQDQQFDLSTFDNVMLVGFGKGSAGISAMLEKLLGDRLSKGWVIDASPADLTTIEFTQGTHPLPSQANLDFTNKVINELSNVSDKDLVLVVTCGGGSALLEAPVTLDLEGITKVNKALLQAGANITEMNLVRRHVSKVKGGGLAKALYPATIANLLFSDVPGNDLSVIASGPTVKDPSTIDDAIAVLDKYNLSEKAGITKEDFTETPKEDKYFEKLTNILILSNRSALEAMQKRAEELGYQAEIFSDAFEGEAKTSGQKLLEQTQPGTILLAGGETTVKIEGEAGEGGRNQEVVLGALPHLQAGQVLVSFASDGWDNTPAAGAIGDQETLEKANQAGLSVEETLTRHNSLEFFTKVADTIQTGRLASNVADLYIVIKG